MPLKLADVFSELPKLPSNSVDLVLTDIPYLVSRKTNFKEIKDFTRKSGETEYSCMQFGTWDQNFELETYIAECCRLLKPSRSIVVWAAWQQLAQIEAVIKKSLGNKCGSSRIGVWEKTNPAVFNMQRMAIQPFEFFIWNRNGSNWIFNNQNSPHPEKHFFRHACIAGGHTTAKPVAIFEHLIRTYTDEGQLVFDGLVGGGTTAVACVRTRREFICFENDPYSFRLAEKALTHATQTGP